MGDEKKPRSKVTGAGHGKDTWQTKSFIPEPRATTVAEYALKRMHVVLDTDLPTVKCDSLLGKECVKAIDAAYELQRSHVLFGGRDSEVVRLVLRAILSNAVVLENPSGDFEQEVTQFVMKTS